MAQSFYSPSVVAVGQVPSSQTNFPKLSFPTDNRFRTIANGGHVANSNGFDIRPYSDSGLTTPLTYELVYYNASTGQFEMHVKIPTLSDGYTTYFGYGDASLNSDGSSSTTWSNSFLGVYHLKDGTTLNVNSSTGSNNGTNHNTVTAVAGQIDGAGGFASASTQYVDLSNGMNPSTGITLSAWVKATSFPNAYNSVITRSVAGPSNAFILVKSTGKLACGCTLIPTTQKIYDGTGSHTLSTATWTYVAMTYDTSTGLIGYVNAASDGTDTAGAALSTTPAPTRIGSDPVTSPREWNGSIDEVRFCSAARSANWLTTEYNNQSAPGTFETLGTEVPFGTSVFERRTLGSRIGSRQRYVD